MGHKLSYFVSFPPGMKRPPIILRVTACVLILAFSQKSWAGLYLHNFLHGGKISYEFPAKQESRFTANSCSCIDDFLMPFEEAGNPVISHPFTFLPPLVLFLKDRIPFYTPTLLFLRGPPAPQS